MGLVKFNGVSTSELGLIVQFIPTYSYPEREYDTIHIPGRNGDLVIDKGSFQNVERTYSLARVFKPGEHFVSIANSIVSWLHSANGYARLEDSYEPEYYRMAMFKSDGSMSNYYDQATAIDVTFECKPQRWLIIGDKEVSIQTGDSIKNPTDYDSSPNIKFTTVAGQATTITIGDNIMTLASMQESHTIIIDCENMECYDPINNTLHNSKLTLNSGKFPVLKGKTKTTISFTNASNFSIQPRWWTL